MVSIRAKTPSGAAEAIPTPTEMDINLNSG